MQHNVKPQTGTTFKISHNTKFFVTQRPRALGADWVPRGRITERKLTFKTRGVNRRKKRKKKHEKENNFVDVNKL